MERKEEHPKKHDILGRMYFRFPPGVNVLHSSPNYKTDRLRMCEMKELKFHSFIREVNV